MSNAEKYAKYSQEAPPEVAELYKELAIASLLPPPPGVTARQFKLAALGNPEQKHFWLREYHAEQVTNVDFYNHEQEMASLAFYKENHDNRSKRGKTFISFETQDGRQEFEIPYKLKSLTGKVIEDNA